MQQKNRIEGNSTLYGILNTDSQKRTSGTFRINRKQLPIHMLATRPQNRSGCLESIFGPGWMPLMMKAAIISAITAFSGMPEAHQRNEARARGGLVGGGLSGNALDAAGADLVSVLADLLVDGISGELRDRRAAAGQNAEERADRAAAQRARNDALELAPKSASDVILPLNGVRSSRASRFLAISAMPKQPSATLTRLTPSISA